jgi:hypothetical protein
MSQIKSFLILTFAVILMATIVGYYVACPTVLPKYEECTLYPEDPDTFQGKLERIKWGFNHR